jgi:hypothetical protein
MAGGAFLLRRVGRGAKRPFDSTCRTQRPSSSASGIGLTSGFWLFLEVIPGLLLLYLASILMISLDGSIGISGVDPNSCGLMLVGRCDTLDVSAESRLSATIEVLVRTVRAGDQLPYRINNTGAVDLICGMGYSMERATGEGWVLVNPDMAFQTIGLGILPGEHRDLIARVPGGAAAGSYRLSTSVTSNHVEGPLRLSADFEVHVD